MTRISCKSWPEARIRDLEGHGQNRLMALRRAWLETDSGKPEASRLP